MIKKILGSILGVLLLAVIAYESYNKLTESPEHRLLDSRAPVIEPEIFPYKVKKDESFFTTMLEHKVAPKDIHEMVQAAKPHYDFRTIRPGMKFQLSTETVPKTGVNGIKFRLSETETLVMRKDADLWTASLKTKPIEIQLTTFRGVVESSLWESAEAANMDPNLIAELADIFAWQVDFAREVRKGDRWRLVVEEKLVDGQKIGWGRITAAEYSNPKQTYAGFLFIHEGRDYGYFAQDGTSLRKMFLKSPIKFGRISSRFQRNRFHPILKVRKPHLGVDYAAPRGTPVRAVGDGTITYVGRRGGGGKTVMIRHNSTYKTAYKHLNGYARSSRRGRYVKQGQTIGYVGSTGLATGPHLHFEFYKNGRFVDPLGRRFPSASPVPKKLMQVFASRVSGVIHTLPAWEENTLQVSKAEKPNPDPSIPE